MTPSPYSATIPKLQIAWDSTSFKALMTCPRQYQYSILEGWRPAQDKVDLEFGGFFASACEVYKKGRLAGRDKTQATVDALRYVIAASWIKNYEPGKCPCPNGCNGCEIPEGKPWGGRYEEMWRCKGTTSYRNSRGNRAKCQFSHKGNWFPAPNPTVCGECSSETEMQRQWIGDHKVKDRYTLVRLVAWYCDEQPETPAEGPFPYAFPNGQPAVELSFVMPLPWKSPVPPITMKSGEKMYITNDKRREPYLLCGHLDSIMQFGSERFISDNKTTKNALGQAYFAAYSPNIQVDIYDLAGNALYPSLNLRGVMIEGAQVLQEGARFGVGVQYRSDLLREELLQDLRYWLDQAERFAQEDYWPMNRASCYLCPFKMVCSKEPQMRQGYLEANFVKRIWNPLEER